VRKREQNTLGLCRSEEEGFVSEIEGINHFTGWGREVIMELALSGRQNGGEKVWKKTVVS